MAFFAWARGILGEDNPDQNNAAKDIAKQLVDGSYEGEKLKSMLRVLLVNVLNELQSTSENLKGRKKQNQVEAAPFAVITEGMWEVNEGNSYVQIRYVIKKNNWFIVRIIPSFGNNKLVSLKICHQTKNKALIDWYVSPVVRKLKEYLKNNVRIEVNHV